MKSVAGQGANITRSTPTSRPSSPYTSPLTKSNGAVPKPQYIDVAILNLPTRQGTGCDLCPNQSMSFFPQNKFCLRHSVQFQATQKLVTNKPVNMIVYFADSSKRFFADQLYHSAGFKLCGYRGCAVWGDLLVLESDSFCPHHHKELLGHKERINMIELTNHEAELQKLQKTYYTSFKKLPDKLISFYETAGYRKVPSFVMETCIAFFRMSLNVPINGKMLTTTISPMDEILYINALFA
jgi:hypothetical protein